MKLIELKKTNQFVEVDDSDFEELKKYTWFVFSVGKHKYVRRYVKGEKKWVMMSRQITNAKERELVTYQNGNRLDNRRSNLKITDRPSLVRSTRVKTGASNHKGISILKTKYGIYYRIQSGKCVTTNSLILARVIYSAIRSYIEGLESNDLQLSEEDKILILENYKLFEQKQISSREFKKRIDFIEEKFK